MTRSQALLLPALLVPALLLGACQPSAPAGDAAATAQPAAGTSGPSADAQAAAASAAAAAGAQSAAPATAADAAPADAGAGSTAPTNAPTAADDLTPGVDYVEIQGGEPYQPLAGKIEVVEVFGYVCPACARFEPMFTAWKEHQPADVRVTYVPAPFGPEWIPYARSFYVADAMGLVGKTHTALFHAIHIAQTLPGEGKKPDENAVAAWYGQYGADPKQFLADMHSFGTEAKIKRGQQFMVRTQVGGTPTLVVDGKYRVLGRSYEDMLRITDALVARERAARGGTAP
jgi:thiol:disulfide interchange protein DsbA